MDDTDLKLVSALRKNARASLSALSSELGMARATVRARMEKLEARGDIIGYSVILREDVQTSPVRGLMMLRIEGRGTERIMRIVSGFPEVQAVHSTNGTWDLVLEISTDTLEALDKVLFAIRKIEGVQASETNLLLSTR
jgi:DNA-binding Lrp family transcriptional regulator